MAEDYITVREAAARSGKNPETIRRWIWSGKLSAEKIGNQLFIKKSEFSMVCRETAVVEYTAEPKPEFIGPGIDFGGKHGFRKMERNKSAQLFGKPLEKAMSETEETVNDKDAEIKSIEDWLERVKNSRDRMSARGVKPIDSAEIIRKIREERMDEIERNIKDTSSNDIAKVEDFLKRTRAFRNMLRKRIGDVDTAELVRESREEREVEFDSMR
ncbi:MAG: helix-turn-helix domain-containing protein [Dehalococcoidia bacterium]|nr:helix-turn-helix domain-containing protein [Dehalococcoidia bacterium]